MKKCFSILMLATLTAVFAHAQSSPAITGFSPASGIVNSTVTILGTNFSPAAANDTVRFGALRAAVLGASPTSLTVVVPAGATRCPLTVTVNGLTAYASIPFLVTCPNPASKVVAWGDNSYGQTNVPPRLTDAIAISAAACNEHNLVLKADGTVAAWGSNVEGESTVPAGLSNVVEIAAGGYHNLVLKADGTVSAWGYNSNIYDGSYSGQGTVPASLTHAIAIAAGWYHSLALKPDGTVFAWGVNTQGQTNVPAGLSNVVAIAGAPSYSLALKIDGTVVAWGTNYQSVGEVNYPVPMDAPAGLSNVVAIAAGYFHCLALKADGTIVAWGDNSYGQTNVPAGLSNVVAIAAGSYHSLAVKSDGTVVDWGISYPYVLNQPAGLTNVVAIGAGYFHSLALLNNSAFGQPVITGQPTDQTVALGATATFTVTATGTQPLSYQWNCNGTNIVGATNSWLALNNVLPALAGYYSVLVSNSAGSVASSNAMLTVPASPSCTPPPAGMVGWWKGDGTAMDVVSGNNGVLVNVTYTNGVDGQAFACDPESYPYGTYTGVQIADQPAYALTNALTIEGWIRPRGDGYNIFWRGDNRPGVDPYYISMQGNQVLEFLISDENNNYDTVGAPLTYGVWVHVAAVFDGNAGTLSLYTNGVLAAQKTTTIRPFGNLIAGDSPGIGIGNVNDGFNNFPFTGDIDEIALYNRALAPAEIQAIFNAGSAGKCTSQPAPPPSCTPPPAGIVSWWPADENVNDIIGANNGSVTQGTVGYVPGEVGLAFNFDGGANRIVVPDAPALNFGAGQDFSAETWIRAYPQPGNWNGGIETIFDKRVAPDSITQLGYNFELDANGHFSFQMADTLAAYSWHNFIAPSPYLEDGQWHHIAATVVRNSTNGGTLYVDGNVVLTFDPTVCPGSLVNSGPFRIGNHADTNDNLYTYFSGNIDELSIYSRALSSNEVAAIYNAGSAGKCQTSLPISGLVLWNTLGSDTEVSNSVYGPNLQKYVGGTWPDVAANTIYGPGEFGNAVGIGPGGYISESRVHNLVLNNLAQVINPNQGTIDVWFLQNWTPTAYVDGAIRIFDGDYGLNSGMGFVSLPPPNNLAFGLTFGGTTTAVNYDISASNGTWLNLAGIWDIAGIDGSADKLRLYVNGQLVAANTNATWGTTVGSQADIAGGQDSDCAGQFLVDNLKVFNRALTASEVAQVYGGGEGFNSGPPAIYNFSPAAATNGAVVAIAGNNFSPVPANNIVYFGAVRANVLSASANSLTVTVPPGASYAPITVTLNGLTVWANAPFMPTFNGGTNGLALAPRLDLPAGDGPGQAIFADVDGDGKPDLLVNSGSPHFMSIYRNISTNGALLGAASFAPRVDVPMPGAIQNAVLADVDGDGKLDIVVLDRDAGQVHILKNLSTPGNITTNSFAPSVNLSTGNDPRGIVVRDLDGDGLPDIAVANWADSTVFVFRNLGTTTGITTNSFAAPVVFAVGANPQDLKAADLDGDGKPDLVTANNNYSTTNSVSLLRNTSSPGTISFAPQVALAGLPTCYWLAIGDLDGDGKPDIAVSSFDQGQSVSVYRNISSPGSLTAGSFAQNVDFAAGGWGNAVAIGDLDGDGKPDLAVVTQLPDHLSIFKNVSTPGSFTASSLAPRVDYPTGWNPNGIAIGDLDGDGRPDIAFAADYAATVSIYQNLTASPTNPPVVNPPVITSVNPLVGAAGANVTISGSNFNAIATSDIVYFGAMRATVLAASANSLTVTVPAGATFGPVTVTVGGLTAYSGQLFEPTFSGGGTNITTTSFAPSFNIGANGPGSCVIADLDGDGKPDIALVTSGNHSVAIFQNITTNGAPLGMASFAPRLDLSFPTNGISGDPYRLRAVDLDGDGKLDLIACEVNGNRVSVFHNISSPGPLTTNSFEPAFALIADSDCRFATAADLDGDGRVDIVALNYGAKTISLFKNIGTAGSLNVNSFAPPVVLAAPGGPYEAAIADLDGDGKPDLAVAESDGGTVFIYQNAGGDLSSNSFPSAFELSCGNTTATIAVADLDGDGRLDLVAGSVQSETISVFQNISTGGLLTANSFGPRVDFGTGDWTHTVAIADFNGDGKPDIVVVGELPSTLSIFQNISTPGSFTSASLAPRVDFGTGWNSWGVAAGDLDGDGRPDIVFCNYYDNNIQIYQNVMPFGTTSAMPPVITAQPTNQTLTAGSTATFSVAVTGSQPVSYQWQLNGTNLPPFIGTVAGNGVGVYSGDGGTATGAGLDSPNGVASDAAGNIYIADTGDNRIRKVSPSGIITTMAGNGIGSYGGDGGAATNASLNNPNGVALDAAGNLYIADRSNQRIRKVDTNGTITTVAGNGSPGSAYGGNGIPATSASLWNPQGVALDAAGNLFIADWFNSLIRKVDTNGIITTFAGNGNTFYGGDGGPATNASLNNPQSVALDDAGNLYIADKSNQRIRKVSPDGIITTVAGNGIGAYAGDGGLATDASFNNPQGVGLDPLGNLFIADAGNNCIRKVDTNGIVTTVAGNGIGTYGGDGGAATSASLNNPQSVAWNARGNLLIADSSNQRIREVHFTGYPTLVLDNIGANNAGNYTVVITGSFGSVTSEVATLTVLLPPVIVSQPTNITATVNGAAVFTVAASGTAPLIYYWNFNGTNISVGTNAALTLNNVQPWQAGNYFVTVSNLVGGAVSSNAMLSVYQPPTPPTILAQTPSQVVLLGNPAIFGVTAGGSEPLSYFWSRNGALIPNATNSTYTLPNAQLADSGSQFSCLVSNAYGSASSTNVTLKVLDTIANDLCSGAITITNASYTNVQSTLKASSFGDPSPDCVDGFGHGVWYQFTAPVAGQLVVDTFGSDFDTGLAVYTGSCGSLTEMACNDDTDGVTSQVILPTAAGTTYFILAGGYGSDAGNLVLHLNHLTAPALVTQPADESVLTGSNATFSATLVGALPMSFQWYFNGNPLADDGMHIAGSATANLIISNVTTADAGSYSLAVTNFLGATNSTAAALTVLVPPTITTQPVGRSVPPGLPTTFTALATGIPSPTYQWQLNGTNLPGWTIANYTIATVGTNNLGFYALVASNSVGSVTSTVAQLTFGPVAAWGRNLSGESLPPPGLSNVVGVAGSYPTSFAIHSDGSLAIWGSGIGTNVPASATNVVALALTGGSGNYALRSDGTVVGWSGYPPPSTLSNIVSVAAGNFFALALRAEGTVVGWGNTPYSTVPAGLNHVVAISCGNTHSLALRSDGTVVTWGTGAGTNMPANVTNVVAVAAGFYHSLALKSNGTITAWGSGAGTNLPAGLTNIVAISTENIISSSLSLALRANGTVVAWGDNAGYGETNPPPALTNLLSVAVAAAPFHGLALVNDGRPQILQPPIGLTAYTGRSVTLQARAVGTAPLSYQWLLNGTNVSGATNTSLAIPNVQFANAGNYQLFVSNSVSTAISLPAPVNVISNNTLIFLSQTSVSSSNVYQGGKVTFYGGAVLGNGPLHYQWFSSPTNRSYTAVAGATNDTLALDPALAWQSGNYYLAVSNGFVQPPPYYPNYAITSAPVNVRILFARAWGLGAVSNPPVNVTNAIEVATGGGSGITTSGLYLALSADGKVTAWANYFPIYGETNVSVLTNYFVTAIAAGYQTALALKSDGTVYAWGFGGYGQTNVPAGLNNVVAISCGGYHDLALKSDGTVVAWGDSLQAPFYGQATNNPAATNVVAIAAGNTHSLALRADGSVVQWGNLGGLPVPISATNVVAIAAGSSASVALRADGTVVQWGTGIINYPVPLNLSNVVAISANASHVTALKNDGSVVSWGSAYLNLASNSVPSDVANVAQISSGGDHDFALLGTRAPIFTVQPWDRSLVATSSVVPVTTITLAGKVVGVQPMSYQWKLNGTNVPNATNDTLKVRYDVPPFVLPPGSTYQLVASNAYGIVASKPVKVTWSYSLGYALEAPSWPWTTTGNAQWYGQTNYVHQFSPNNPAAARSGGIGGLQETILQTTITNLAGNLTFWWKVSSEQFFDILEFKLNGVSLTNISGEVDWQQVSIPLPAGTNLLQWRYSKDATFDSGLDAGFVDQVAFVAAPLIVVQPARNVTANLGNTVTLTVVASGPPTLGYQWTHNGNPVGGDSSVLTMNNAARPQDGIYSVTVTNAGGAAVSSNAVVHVNVPQLLGTPKLLSNGAFQVTSTDANGDTLSPSDLANFEAQASTNLVDWVTLPNALSITNGMLQLQDSGSNYTVRYYRIIEH